MEGEERDSENGDEAVDAGALVRGKYLPPLNGSVGKNHSDVKRHNRGEDGVQVVPRNHFVFSGGFSEKKIVAFDGELKGRRGAKWEE